MTIHQPHVLGQNNDAAANDTPADASAPATSQADQPANAGNADALRDPVLDADAMIKSRRATSWRSGETRWLLLEEDVEFLMGAYGFRAARALIRIDREAKPGQTVHHLALYLDDAQSIRGRARIEAQAPRLLITASTRGRMELATDLMQPQAAAPAEAFVQHGQQRITRHLAALAEGTARVDIAEDPFDPQTHQRRREQTQQPEGPRPQGELHVQPDTEEPAQQPTTRPTTTITPPTEPRQPEDQQILPAQATVHYSFDAQRGQITSAPLNESTRAVSLMGEVRIMYQDHQSGRTMTLTAENVVIFVDDAVAETIASGQMSSDSVQGIYLEENVIITDGEMTVRAPRIYLDPKQNKAVLLDAVVFTVDPGTRLPLYMRAAEIRQEARHEFSARDAILTTSDFAEPHFSIKASKMTLDRTADDSGEPRNRFSASGLQPRVGDASFFWWPYMAGRVRDTALQRIDIGVDKDRDDDYHPDIHTRWNLFALAGRETPEGVSLTGDVDWRGDHGLGLGTNLQYKQPDMFGMLQGYFLPDDDGEDEIGGRQDIQHDNERRGFAQWQHRQYMTRDIELSLEFAYVSDETFLEEFYETQATNSKLYETSFYLKQQREDWAFSFLTSYNINDFIPQTTVLQSPGYFVDKVPELGYWRVGTSLLDDRLTYFTENRISRMRIRGGNDTPADRGFNATQSALLFGMSPFVTFDSALVGVPSDYRARFDSRHEFQLPMRVSALDVVPYVAGRLTAYDEDFSAYSGEGDNARLWGIIGTRFHTQFHSTMNDVRSRIFDLHRLRHILEPSVNVFLIGSTVNSEDLPIYDRDVEALAEGFGTRLGLRNTWQTQRGGEGQWRTVDWLVINTDFILRSDDADVQTLLPHYFDYRPEYSIGGDHFYTDMQWMVSDTFAIVGDLTHSFEHHEIPVWRIGAFMQHTPRLTSFIDYTEIEALDELLTFGFNYDLTRKYRIGYRQRLSMSDSETRDISLTVERRIPQWTMVFVARHDDINDEQSFTVSLIPTGFDFGEFGGRRVNNDFAHTLPFDTEY